MIPVLSVAEMAAVDAAAPEPVEELIERAGSVVAWAAVQMLDGSYGKRVVVVAGKGNNGADGRAAGRRLAERGRARRTSSTPKTRHPCCRASDLVIDAAYGTGFHGEYDAPDPNGAPVLSVDIPSGVNGDTGVACDGAVRAYRTVTMGALKPGLLLADGPDHAGDVQIEPIGLDASDASVHLVEERGRARVGAAPAPDRPQVARRGVCDRRLAGSVRRPGHGRGGRATRGLGHGTPGHSGRHPVGSAQAHRRARR